MVVQACHQTIARERRVILPYARSIWALKSGRLMAVLCEMFLPMTITSLTVSPSLVACAKPELRSSKSCYGTLGRDRVRQERVCIFELLTKLETNGICFWQLTEIPIESCVPEQKTLLQPSYGSLTKKWHSEVASFRKLFAKPGPSQPKCHNWSSKRPILAKRVCNN